MSNTKKSTAILSKKDKEYIKECKQLWYTPGIASNFLKKNSTTVSNYFNKC